MSEQTAVPQTGGETRYEIPRDKMEFAIGDAPENLTVLQRSGWIAYGQSRWPKAAQKQFIARAKKVGGNGLVNVTSSLFYGPKGTFIHGVHDFSGEIVLVGRPAEQGVTPEELPDLDAAVREQIARNARMRLAIHMGFWLVALFFAWFGGSFFDSGFEYFGLTPTFWGSFALAIVVCRLMLWLLYERGRWDSGYRKVGTPPPGKITLTD